MFLHIIAGKGFPPRQPVQPPGALALGAGLAAVKQVAFADDADKPPLVVQTGAPLICRSTKVWATSWMDVSGFTVMTEVTITSRAFISASLLANS
jgi:hypothetical protein